MAPITKYRWTKEERAEWGIGPWTLEADRCEWIDPMTELPCQVQRGPMGALCGYVGVGPGHRFHGKQGGQCSGDAAGSLCPVDEPFDWESWEARENYPEALRTSAAKMQEMARERGWDQQQHCDHSAESLLSVHGGITWADAGPILNRETWQRFRERMEEARADMVKYPRGDSARYWRLQGSQVEDYDAWVVHTAIHVVGLQDRPELWWLGFDCGHYMDLVPGMIETYKRLGMSAGTLLDGTYRTMGYVVQEVTDLARRIADLGPSKPRRAFAKEDV